MAQIIGVLLFACMVFGSDAKAICGLKTLSAPLDSVSLRDLAYIGVEFIFDAPIQSSQQTGPKNEKERGLVVLTDFDLREEVFQKWVELATILPKEIIQVSEGNLVELQIDPYDNKSHVVVLRGSLAEEVDFFNELIDKLLGSLPLSLEDEFLEPFFPK